MGRIILTDEAERLPITFADDSYPDNPRAGGVTVVAQFTDRVDLTWHFALLTQLRRSEVKYSEFRRRRDQLPTDLVRRVLRGLRSAVIAIADDREHRHSMRRVLEGIARKPLDSLDPAIQKYFGDVIAQYADEMILLYSPLSRVDRFLGGGDLDDLRQYRQVLENPRNIRVFACRSVGAFFEVINPDSRLKALRVLEDRRYIARDGLEGFGATVTWDDRIADPDQPGRRRQIDVTIRRGDHLTLVECRFHRVRQDVKWIEELMGRRQSLQANAVIAVSSSGFTAGALAKARTYGIAARALRDLTDDEVRSWARSVKITLFFYQYSDVQLRLIFKTTSLPRLDVSALRAELAKHALLQSVFNAAATVVSKKLLPSEENQSLISDFCIRLALDPLRLCGEPVLEVEVAGSAQLVSQMVDGPTVMAYGTPDDTETNAAIIEQFKIVHTAVVHDGNRISTFVDLSHVEVPPLRQLRFIRVLSPTEVEHEVLSIIGIRKLYVQDGSIHVAVLGQV